MSRIAVIVPWRAGDPDRERSWAFLRPQWPWPVHEGEVASDAAWCKADAVRAAVDGTDAEILVIADADVWCDDINAAVAAIDANAAAWAIPHGNVHRLNEFATDLVIGAGIPPRFVEPAGHAQAPYRGFEGGGIVVLRRTTYLDCPLDPRFVGWGQEDESWALALHTLHGAPWRGTAPLWHLWHAPQVRRSRRWGSPASQQLHRRYRAATASPDCMRTLLAESRVAA